MGYVIVPPKYIEGEGPNYHIFKASVNEYDNKYVEISNKSICNIKPVYIKEQYESINCFRSYKILLDVEHNINDFFNKNIIFQENNNGIIYITNDRNLKIVCALLKVDICGVCMSTIY